LQTTAERPTGRYGGAGGLGPLTQHHERRGWCRAPGVNIRRCDERCYGLNEEHLHTARSLYVRFQSMLPLYFASSSSPAFAHKTAFQMSSPGILRGRFLTICPLSGGRLGQLFSRWESGSQDSRLRRRPPHLDLQSQNEGCGITRTCGSEGGLNPRGVKKAKVARYNTVELTPTAATPAAAHMDEAAPCLRRCPPRRTKQLHGVAVGGKPINFINRGECFYISGDLVSSTTRFFNDVSRYHRSRRTLCSTHSETKTP